MTMRKICFGIAALTLTFLLMGLLIHEAAAELTWFPNRYDSDGDGKDDFTVWEEREGSTPTGRYTLDRDADDTRNKDASHSGVTGWSHYTETDAEGKQWRIVEFRTGTTVVAKHKLRDKNQNGDCRDTNEAYYWNIDKKEWVTMSVVGGVVVPVDKFGLLAPYIGLASTIAIAAVASVVYVKRVRRRKEKQ